MRQRIQIAKALSQGADVLLLDEPFVGVEHGVRLRIMELLERDCGPRRAPAWWWPAGTPRWPGRWPTTSWCSTTAK